MSTTVATIDTARPGIPFSRLLNVELRKMFNTRAGRWYTFSILLLCVVVVAFCGAFFKPRDFGYGDVIGIVGGVLGFFLPVIPILLVTSEWSQRTGLVTFTLEPRRPRIVVSKLVASILVSLATIVVAAVIALVAVWFFSTVRGFDAQYDVEFALMRNFVLTNALAVVIGFAFAMLIMNTPAAIVAYFFYAFVLPIAFGAVSAGVDGFEDIVPWFDFNWAQGPLFTGDYLPDAKEWAQLVTSGTIWLILPSVLGTLRLLKSEVK